MNATIAVLRPGSSTTVQDLGRPGYRSQGVPAGGAFDPWAARAANRLVGNADEAAVLEVTLLGPRLKIGAAVDVAIVGDLFEIELDGGEPDQKRKGPVKEGSVLQLGRARAGVRCWIAVGGGGFDLPEVLDSRSTDLTGGFGGHRGRALRADDELPLFPSMVFSLFSSVSSSCGELFLLLAPPGEETILRVLPGPDEGEVFEELVERSWRVAAESDRRGVRLRASGAPVAPPPRPPMRSYGVLPGAVQLPASGEPIVLGVDAPVTGGYPWVAQVVEADVGRLAHIAPGARVRFAPVSLAEAAAALAERERGLAGVRR
jgi:biotin-dependent carboxylase-like uncharacterized protein